MRIKRQENKRVKQERKMRKGSQAGNVPKKFKMERGIRIALFTVAVIAVIWFLLPLCLAVSLSIGNLTGLVVAVLLAAYAVWMPGVHKILAEWSRHRVKKWLVRCVFGLIGLIAVLVVIESTCMAVAANKKSEEGATVVVLGCRVYGERASLMLIERLETAYEYLTEHEDAMCVLSGGQGPGESISEAECMYRYLVAKGIDPERLYKEDKSTDTRENLTYSKKLIEEQGLHPAITIVTNEFHAYRAGQIAKSLGMEYGAVSGRTAIWLFPTYYVRELYAILELWVLE